MRVRLRFRWRPGREDLIWVLPGAAFVILQVLEKLLVPGKAGGTTDITANLTFPFWDMTRGLASDFKRMSWTHLGMYDINLIEFTALAVVVISALFMLRSTTAPPHERVGLACFVLIEIVMASWQFWGSVFGDGRTYIDSFLLACLILLATPSHAEEGAETTASRHLVTNKRLGVIAAVAAAALIVVARRRILFE